MKVALLTTDSRENYKDYGKSTPYFGSAPAALLQGFEELSDLSVHVVSCLQKKVSSPEKIGTNVWYHALHVPATGWLRTGYQGCIRAVRRKLRIFQPDIVHGQGTERDCAISGVFSGYPNVLTIHGNHRLLAKVMGAKPFSFGWLTARLESFVLPRTDGVVCITSYTQEAVRDLAKKTWIVPNAVDKRFFDVARQTALPSIILCVGQICARKNQQQLIRALDPLAANHQFVLRFLGEIWDRDPYSAEFMSLVRDRAWCQYTGFAGRDELARQLSAATLLVLPSLEDNCPMVILEAMASGVPVVGSRVGGIPDLIEHGKTGYLCEPTDAQSIRAQVGLVLDRPQVALEIAARAKTLAYQRFHPKEVASRHLDIYREVLNRQRR